MKIIPSAEADFYWIGPVLQRRADAGLPPFGPEWRVFPNMRASWDVLVFSSGWLVKLAQWWETWKSATGFQYVTGSQMCESGTKRLIGEIQDAVLPFRGTGRVPMEVLDAARASGVQVPEQRLGDFTEGAYRLNVSIPSGVNLNGVTDGGHSTPGILVEEPDGRVVARVFEWQNSRWLDWEDAVKNGVKLVDCLD